MGERGGEELNRSELSNRDIAWVQAVAELTGQYRKEFDNAETPYFYNAVIFALRILSREVGVGYVDETDIDHQIERVAYGKADEYNRRGWWVPDTSEEQRVARILIRLASDLSRSDVQLAYYSSVEDADTELDSEEVGMRVARNKFGAVLPIEEDE